MHITTINTLEITKRLEKVGFEKELAEALTAEINHVYKDYHNTYAQK